MFNYQSLDQWITVNHVREFTSVDVQRAFGVSAKDAGSTIQQYRRSQFARARGALRTSHVISREGRTGNTVWLVGATKPLARSVVVQFANDVACKFRRDTRKTLVEMAWRNPAAVPEINAALVDLDRSLKALIRVAAKYDR